MNTAFHPRSSITGHKVWRPFLHRMAWCMATAALAACGGGSDSPAAAGPAPTALPQISIIAGALGGNGFQNGTGSQARMGQLQDSVFESNGNLLLADPNNQRIRRVTPAGVVSDVPGGTGINARSLAVEADGSILAADNSRIYRIDPAGVRVTLAGDSSTGHVDGTGTAARLNQPSGLVVDTDGSIYFANRGSHTIRKMTPAGVVTTIAGTPNTAGNDAGAGSVSTFRQPSDLALYSSSPGTKMLLVADTGNHRIRSVVIGTVAIPGAPALHTVAHFAGSTAGSTSAGLADGDNNTVRFHSPSSVATKGAYPLTTVYVGDSQNGRIRARDPLTAQFTTLFGPPTALGFDNYGTTDGTAANARFLLPGGLAVSPTGVGANRLAITDTNSPVIRMALLDSATVSTLAGTAASDGTVDGVGETARFNGFVSAMTALPSGALIAAQNGSDTVTRLIRRIGPSGTVSTDATPTPYVYAMDSNAAGDTYYMTNEALFKLANDGASTLVAGNPTVGGFADGPGSTARFQNPDAIAVADDGTVYITEFGTYRLRKVSPAGVVSTIAGNGTSGTADGTGSAARLSDPFDMVLDRSTGRLILLSGVGNLREISPTGVVTTRPGSAICFGRIAVDSQSNVYCGNRQRITRITPSGTESVLLDTPADGTRLVRTGTVNPSFNRIDRFLLVGETATSLEFAVSDALERVILRLQLPK